MQQSKMANLIQPHNVWMVQLLHDSNLLHHISSSRGGADAGAATHTEAVRQASVGSGISSDKASQMGNVLQRRHAYRPLS